MAAVVPRVGRLVDLVGLVNGIDRGLDIPETSTKGRIRQIKRVFLAKGGGLTGRLLCFVRCRRIHLGFRCGSARMGLIEWNKKGYRIVD